jgi:hypothetical protein
MTEHNSFSRAKTPLIVIGVALVAILVVAASGLTDKIRAWYSTATITGQAQSYLLDADGKVNGLLLKDGKQIVIQAEGSLPAAIKPGDNIKVEGELGAATEYGQHVRAFNITNTTTGATVLATEPKPPQSPPSSPDAKPTSTAAPAQVDPQSPSSKAADSAGAPASGSTIDPAKGAGDAQTAPPPPGTAPTPDAPQAKQMTASGKITAFLVNPRGVITGCVLAKEQLHFSPQLGQQLISRGGRVGMEVTATGRGAQGEFGTFIVVDQLSLDGKPITQQ